MTLHPPAGPSPGSYLGFFPLVVRHVESTGCPRRYPWRLATTITPSPCRPCSACLGDPVVTLSVVALPVGGPFDSLPALSAMGPNC